MHRTTDQATCCIFKSKARVPQQLGMIRVHPLVEDGETITSDSKMDLSKTQKPRVIRLQEKVDPDEQFAMKRSVNTGFILQKLPKNVYFGADLCFSVVDGGNVALTKLEIVALTVQVDNDEADGSVHTFRNAEHVEHGVSLLHILSELEGF